MSDSESSTSPQKLTNQLDPSQQIGWTRENLNIHKELRSEDREDRRQTHGHKLSWAMFVTDTVLLFSLTVGGFIFASLGKTPIQRNSGMIIVSGVVGAVMERARQHGNRRI